MKKNQIQSGVTLAEIVVVVAIIGLMVNVVGSFQRNVFYYSGVARDSLTTAQDARTILRTMTTELRSASPSGTGAYPIVTAGTSSIIFFSDVDGNGVKERIQYFASTTKLYRGVIVPTGFPLMYVAADEKLTLISSNLRNTASTTIFTYYDGNYNGSTSTAALAQPVAVSAIRLVQISLILDVNQNNLPVSRTYTSQITLRNLKDNL